MCAEGSVTFNVVGENGQTVASQTATVQPEGGSARRHLLQSNRFRGVARTTVRGLPQGRLSINAVRALSPLPQCSDMQACLAILSSRGNMWSGSAACAYWSKRGHVGGMLMRKS